MLEELGINDFTPISIGKYLFESPREQELIYVHRTTYDGEINPSLEELDGGRFWTIQEIREARGKGVFTPNLKVNTNDFLRSQKQYETNNPLSYLRSQLQWNLPPEVVSKNHGGCRITRIEHLEL